MSRKGKVIWEAPHKRCDVIGNLAVSTTVFYYILGSSSMHKNVFVARTLEDGTAVLQEDVPFWTTDDPACRLQLFGNAQWASFEDADNSVWIINTNSGKIVFHFYGALDNRPSFSSTECRFWIFEKFDRQTFWDIIEYSYDANANSFIRKQLWLEFTKRAESFVTSYDSNRQLCFRVNRDKQRSAIRPSVSFLTAQELVQGDRSRLSKLAESCLATVTLPSRFPCHGYTRRDLDLFRRRRMPDLRAAFCAMVGDYLVVHAQSERELILVDFWPDW